MSIATVKYVLKEGIVNTYKNKLMSLASLSIVIASLIIFGIFLLLAMNINHNTRILSRQPEMQAFCDYELEEGKIEQIEKEIAKNERIQDYTKVTSEEAFIKFKESLGEDGDVLEGFEKDFLPVSFIIKVKDSVKSAEVVEELKKIDGIRKVSYSAQIVDFISRFTSWINLVSSILVIILLAVSVFIIANTIKLTVFARRREINIMKYIGATDWFIRWPFIIEGVIIGLVGAVAAFLIINYGYNALETKFNAEILGLGTDFLQLVSITSVRAQLLGYFGFVGVFVGALGSLISLRKYLRV
jgi:cell division transport system permease protein